MPTPEQIIAEARSCKGTPWRHQGRLKGAALDCAGLVLKVGEALGLVSAEHANRKDYGRQPIPTRMKAGLDEVFDRVHKSDKRPADILWMRVGGEQAQHLGILSECNTLIHAINFKRVEELPIDKMVECRIVAVYRFKNLVAA